MSVSQPSLFIWILPKAFSSAFIASLQKARENVQDSVHYCLAHQEALFRTDWEVLWQQVGARASCTPGKKKQKSFNCLENRMVEIVPNYSPAGYSGTYTMLYYQNKCLLFIVELWAEPPSLLRVFFIFNFSLF